MTMWTLEELVEYSNNTLTVINGKWIPLRPMNWKYRTLKDRFYQSWYVFTGRADAFTWPKGQ